MSNGQWMGQPEHQHWSVELPNHQGFEFVHAQRLRIDGGAAVFTNGDLRELELTTVTAYSPIGYMNVFPALDLSDACPGCAQREGDE